MTRHALRWLLTERLTPADVLLGIVLVAIVAYLLWLLGVVV